MLRLLQGARRICALSIYAYEVVDKRRPKTSSHLRRRKVESHLYPFTVDVFFLNVGNYSKALGQRLNTEKHLNEFVAFN